MVGESSKMIKAFIFDRQSLFRQGVSASISQLSEIEICGEADTGEQMFSIIESSPPDVVLLGIEGPSLESLEICRVIKRSLPSVAIIVLTPHPNDDQFFHALKAQASAYISKAVSSEELVRIVELCARGEHPINEGLLNRPKVAEQILQQFHDLSREREAANFVSPLTPRETEILNHMAEGNLNKQIAEILGISEQTIKNHITSILRKLNVNARTQAVVVAIKKGLISISVE